LVVTGDNVGDTAHSSYDSLHLLLGERPEFLKPRRAKDINKLSEERLRGHEVEILLGDSRPQPAGHSERGDQRSDDEVRIENRSRGTRIHQFRKLAAMDLLVTGSEGTGCGSLRPNLANSAIHLPNDHPRIRGAGFLLQVFRKQEKLPLRRDHEPQKLQPVIRFQSLDLLGQIADLMWIVRHGVLP
jgi:hypothetical protein